MGFVGLVSSPSPATFFYREVTYDYYHIQQYTRLSPYPLF